LLAQKQNSDMWASLHSTGPHSFYGRCRVGFRLDLVAAVVLMAAAYMAMALRHKVRCCATGSSFCMATGPGPHVAAGRHLLR